MLSRKKEREKNGLKPLTPSQKLMNAAAVRAEEATMDVTFREFPVRVEPNGGTKKPGLSIVK